MTKVSDLHLKWMKKKDYRKAYEELAPEFALARAVIDARVTAGLHSGATCAANGYNAIGHSSPRKRTDTAIDADA